MKGICSSDHVLRVYRAIRRKDMAQARVQVTTWPETPREIFSADHARDALRQARAYAIEDYIASMES